PNCICLPPTPGRLGQCDPPSRGDAAGRPRVPQTALESPPPEGAGRTRSRFPPLSPDGRQRSACPGPCLPASSPWGRCRAEWHTRRSGLRTQPPEGQEDPPRCGFPAGKPVAGSSPPDSHRPGETPRPGTRLSLEGGYRRQTPALPRYWEDSPDDYG